MVNLSAGTCLRRGLLVAAALLWGHAGTAWALLGQTASDLAVLEDALRHAVETEPGLASRSLPLLLATPVHYWQESKADFAAEATKVIKNVFSGPSDVIACSDCDAWRLHVRDGASLDIDNGELGLTALGRIRQDPRYTKAKAVAYVEETPAGVELRIVEITDGRILFDRVADSSERLGDVKPYLGLEEERERRLRGESLSYVFLNLGLYPNPLLQAEFVEQWGDRNQHISGVALSLLNPNAALGIVYHYMLPSNRRVNLGGSLYFPLLNALGSLGGNNQNSSSSLVGQGMIAYTFANSYAVFASISSQGTFSVGFNLYNPLFLPFLL